MLLVACCAAVDAGLVQPWTTSRDQQVFQTTRDDVKVPVILGVMSRCPDAIFCESVFDRVLQRVGDKVDLSLTFIGKCVRSPHRSTPSRDPERAGRLNASAPDFGVTCMHGPDECAGNVQELCALKYAPRAQWWSFVQCQNFQGRPKIGTPEVALQCADTANIDWVNSGIGDCAGLDGSGKGPEGVRLLQESVVATQKLGVQ